jgi:hypothetical protein
MYRKQLVSCQIPPDDIGTSRANSSEIWIVLEENGASALIVRTFDFPTIYVYICMYVYIYIYT